MIRKVLAVAGKEWLILLKDRGALAVLFLLPLVLASVFGSISNSVTAAVEGDEAAMSMPVILVNQDGGPYGQQIEATLGRIAVLGVTRNDSAAWANQAVADGEALAAIIVPAGFSDRVNAYEPSTVQVIVDPTQEQYASLVTGITNEVVAPVVLQGEIQYGIREVMDRSGLYKDTGPELRRAMEAQTLGVIMTQLQKQQEGPWITVRNEDLAGVEARGAFNPFSYTIPSFTAMFAFFLVGVVAQSVWLEKESGAFRRLLAAPLQRAAIIAGKMVAYMAVVCLQVIVFLTVGNVVFGMPLGNSFLGLVLLTLALALSSTGLGMLLAALARNSRQADSLGMVLGFVLAAIGGCIGYPLFRVPGLIGTVSRLTPHAQAILGYWSLFEGGDVVTILPRVGILAAMGVAFFAVAMWRFRFE
jgi:ABC-2 type transport system permease protein